MRSARARGVADIRAELERLAQRYGERFRPDPGWDLLAWRLDSSCPGLTRGIHLPRKTFLRSSMDCTATRACPSCAVLSAASRVNPTCGVKPGKTTDGRRRAPSVSCPGLTRASIFFAKHFYEDRWIAGSSPAMTTGLVRNDD